MTVPCSLADSSQRCGWVKTHPYITLGEIKPPSAREVPRRGGGRELCHSPKYFGQPYSSLPHRLRAEPPRRGGQGETVGAAIGRPPALRQPLPSRVVGDADPYAVWADSISARKACQCRRRPRATNGRPYKTKAHPAHSCRMSCGWVGEVRTHECGSQSPVPYHLATTHYKRKGRAGTRLYGLWWGA